MYRYTFMSEYDLDFEPFLSKDYITLESLTEEAQEHYNERIELYGECEPFFYYEIGDNEMALGQRLELEEEA